MTTGALYALGAGLGLVTGFAIGLSVGRSERPSTLPAQWVEVYEACVTRQEMGHRPDCIAAADRVMACAGQKEGQHE